LYEDRLKYHPLNLTKTSKGKEGSEIQFYHLCRMNCSIRALYYFAIALVDTHTLSRLASTSIKV
jgi:hypothetical protein